MRSSVVRREELLRGKENRNQKKKREHNSIPVNLSNKNVEMLMNRTGHGVQLSLLREEMQWQV